MNMKKVIIVGGGAAGLMAAYSAALHGAEAIVLEKMPSVGRKILITGKGRCNVTNIAELSEFIKNIPGNGAFLYSSLHAFDNRSVINFFEEYGVATKIERGGRVFPVSDKAADIVSAFKKALQQFNVRLITGQAVKAILVENGCAVGIITTHGTKFYGNSVIIATGGSSYPGTGSSGDGYEMAKQLGHYIVPLKPSLVPLEVEEDWIQKLQGLSLKNVTAALFCDENKIDEEFGEMLFTHYGLSGPIILSLSKLAAEFLEKNRKVFVQVNLKPALSQEELDKRIQRDFAKYSRKHIKNALFDLLPLKLIDVVIDLAYIDPDKPVHQITKAERSRLLDVITRLTFSISRTRPISEAIVSAGGVSVKEITPKTMESKIVRGLYFAGEVIDIDGYTGGYNLQAAFSTGYVAGRSAAGITNLK